MQDALMIKQATFDTIQEAARLLQAGELVAFPTETVYGLGADATDAKAVSKIYALKNRPSFNPLICHVPDLAAAQELAVFDERARVIAQTFWPGPLTLVLPQQPDNPVAEIATAGLPTIAVRVPHHPTALALLTAAGRPIVAPSANPSGNVSPTSALHVAKSFGDRAPFILADGSSTVGLESTILDLSHDTPILLRPGSVTREDIEDLIGPIQLPAQANPDQVTAPGQLARHYATETPLRLKAVDVRADEALLAFGNINFIGVAGIGFAKDMPGHLYRNLSPEGDLNEAAANLFRMMRELDQSGAPSIAVMGIPDVGIGRAINDRLQRAATPA